MLLFVYFFNLANIDYFTRRDIRIHIFYLDNCVKKMTKFSAVLRMIILMYVYYFSFIVKQYIIFTSKLYLHHRSIYRTGCEKETNKVSVNFISLLVV